MEVTKIKFPWESIDMDAVDALVQSGLSQTSMNVQSAAVATPAPVILKGIGNLVFHSYTAQNIADRTLLTTKVAIPVNGNGEFYINLTELMRAATANITRPDNMGEFQSEMFDYALTHPQFGLTGTVVDIQVIGSAPPVDLSGLIGM